MNPTDWLTLALVIITGGYAWITWRISKANQATVDEMRLQYAAAMSPHIQVTPNLDDSSRCIIIQIENCGKTAANDLELIIKPEIGDADTPELAALRILPAFSRPIQTFAPSSKLRFIVDRRPSLLDGVNGAAGAKFIITANYSTTTDRISKDFLVDTEPFLHSDPNFNPNARALQDLKFELRDGLREIANQLSVFENKRP
ncbi:MAG: hypothetical protein J0I00_09745 [Burkholderiales bacterium]|nr:hypothetical protein [Burkholderiales bacterium]